MPPRSTLPPDFIEDILNIHEMIVQTVDEDIPEPGHFKETVGKLEAAIARIDEVVFGRESFPKLEEKAAILIKELNDLHCFPDGNKRTSLVAMAYYLFWNQQPFTNTTSEATMVRRIADPEGPNPPSFPEIVEWIRENSESIDIKTIASSPRFSRYPEIRFKLDVEKISDETKDTISIRADAVNPKTGRILSRIPFLRRFFLFTQEPSDPDFRKDQVALRETESPADLQPLDIEAKRGKPGQTNSNDGGVAPDYNKSPATARGKIPRDVPNFMHLAPVPDERILRLELDADEPGGPFVALLVAELHLGLETKLHRAGAHVASGTEEHAKRILRVAVDTGADHLYIAGDLKETIPLTTHQERRDVPRFLSLLAPRLDVHIIPGNHDAGIESMIPKHHDITLHSGDGVRIGGDEAQGGVGVFHGHAWPSPDLMKADELVAAHTHPVVALVDPLGHAHTEPCWVRAPIDPDVVAARYGEDHDAHGQTITLLPPFNPLLGGAAVNVDGLLGPGGKLVNLAEARLYLLDGTDLGTLRNLPEVPAEWIQRHRTPKEEDL